MFRSRSLTPVLAALCVISLAACSDFEETSTLETTESFSLIDKEGRDFTVPRGSVKTKVELDKDDGQQIVKLKLKDENGKERKLKLVVPKDVTVPTNGGDAFVAGAKVGQPVDFDFNVDVDVKEYGYGTESLGCDCHTTTQCSGWGEEQTCWDSEVCYGTERNEYHYEDIETRVRMRVLRAGSQHRLGEWNGMEDHTRKVIDSSTGCSSW